jgi:aspartyl-tRNA(Asn)/glutamyl-tRNA(Gln) amidotransferase subunit C
MSLSREEVQKVALLARLDLDPDELDKMTTQLSQIVQYIDLLSQLDTRDIQPMAHPSGIVNVFAKDEVQPSLDREDALRNAPRHDGVCYLVPAVLGE